MKATGIVRRIDDLGRVVVPKEIRKKLHIREMDPLEIYTSGDAIVLKKYDTAESLTDKIVELRAAVADDMYEIGINKAEDIQNLLIQINEMLEE